MTNVNDLSSHKLDLSHNAALRGALTAFARPGLTPQSSHRASPKSTGTSVSTSGLAILKAPPKFHSERPSLSTSTTSRTPINQSLRIARPSDKATSNNVITSISDPSVVAFHQAGLQIAASPDWSGGKSPSNIAAALAVARYSPQRIDAISRPQSAIVGELTDQLQASGTVREVTKWLEALHGSRAVDGSTDEKHSQSREPSPPSSSIFSLPRNPSPSTSEPYIFRADDIVSHQTPQPQEVTVEIKSPKPLRRCSAAASLESAVQVTSSEISASELLDQYSAILELSSDAIDSLTKSEQDMPSPSPTASPNSLNEPTRTTPSPVFRSKVNDEKQAAGTPKPAPSLASEQSVKLLTTLRKYPRMPTVASPRRTSKLSTAATLSSTGVARIRPLTIFRSEIRTELPIVKQGTPSAHSNAQPSPARRVDSLANAIVASHLAATRALSPVKVAAPVLSRRHTEHAHHILPHRRLGNRKARTPSPTKAMARTLRKAKSSSSEEDHQRGHRSRKRLHLRKHPNKHHEGDRKRWRDEMTVRERKRYEGVWAANRGMLLPFSIQELESISTIDTLNSCVSNFIVRDIWTRSRLPPVVLEEIWELVDRDRLGRLGKEEFVVGMWLVDQRLKGRKLPVRVRESVWRSARGIHGLNVPTFKKG